MKESEYQAILKLTAINAMKRALTEEYTKIEQELKQSVISGANNQLVAFIQLNYPHNMDTFEVDRKALMQKVAERFNMPLHIANDLITHYTT